MKLWLWLFRWERLRQKFIEVSSLNTFPGTLTQGRDWYKRNYGAWNRAAQRVPACSLSVKSKRNQDAAMTIFRVLSSPRTLLFKNNIVLLRV